MITYRIPEGINTEQVQGRILLSTHQGGRVVTDTTLMTFWKEANGKSLAEIIELHRELHDENLTRAALVCLGEAGLLERDTPKHERYHDPRKGPLVSVVIVAYNSLEWLKECLPALTVQTYTPIEIIVVDNASTDGCAPWLGQYYPDIRVISLGHAQSFAHAINKGIESASGAYFFVLNPDVSLEPDGIAQLVSVAETDPQCGAVGAKLKFWWAHSFLNGLGNRVGAFSWGTDNCLGHLDMGQFDHWEYLPSACFAAALIPRYAWEKIGIVDESFPMYYEDSEWCYRARMLGYSIRAAPKAVVYHAFGGRIPSGAESGLTPLKLENAVYGRLRFSIKLLGKNLFRFLSNYLVEDLSGFSGHLLHGDWPLARAYLNAWMKTINSFPELLQQRRFIQSRRVIDDDQLYALQRDMPMTFMWHGLPELTWDLIENHYFKLIQAGKTHPMPESDFIPRRQRLLIISQDIIDTKLAGPGMRYLEIARALKADLDVLLAVPADTSLSESGTTFVRYSEHQPVDLRKIVEECDVVLVSSYLVDKFPFLGSIKARLVVDLYNPTVLENLNYYAEEQMASQENLNKHAVEITNHLVKVGDYFICGNERQRDFWIGVLSANGRINPRIYESDPSLFGLIDIVGIGIPEREPLSGQVLKGIHPCIPKDSRIVLWGGGIWDWLDPLTLIKAWPSVLTAHPEIRLVFLGTRHPNPQIPQHTMAKRAMSLAEEIGQKDQTIIFLEWLSYGDREILLREADIGVTLHPVHAETRYSMRTRVMDYMWAMLPTLITEGDTTSQWIQDYDLGIVVPPNDPEIVAKSLIDLLDKPKSDWIPTFQKIHDRFSWRRTVEPLRNYCLTGSYAADRLSRLPEKTRKTGLETWRVRWARARHVYHHEGSRVLLHRTWRYLQWWLSRSD